MRLDYYFVKKLLGGDMHSCDRFLVSQVFCVLLKLKKNDSYAVASAKKQIIATVIFSIVWVPASNWLTPVVYETLQCRYCCRCGRVFHGKCRM